ncbi:MAG: hypothetical protein ABIS86_17025 [Streptosporangiaceae bacterium]
MAPSVLLDVKVTINAVNLSGLGTSASLKMDSDDQETTAFGAGWKSRIGGLKDASLDLEFNQDLAASSVNQTLQPLLGQTVAFTLKQSSGATSATNPEYQGFVFIGEYTPIDGGVGDLAKVKVSYPTSGPVVYATT